MDIFEMKRYDVPTGVIFTAKTERGDIEFISVGDYGKERNIKADFLGISRELNGVEDGGVLPLSEKWVITISTQHGCSMGCRFCDVPFVGAGKNITKEGLDFQIETAIQHHQEVKQTKRLNIHYARMGEPTFNRVVLNHAKKLLDTVCKYIAADTVHPVVSTMMPKKNKKLETFLQEWAAIKNDVYNGEAGLQLSINSTDDYQREWMFGESSLPLADISSIAQNLPKPKGRKYALNFALSDDSIVDAPKLAEMFSPDNFMVKITPIHKTSEAKANGIQTSEGYENYSPYIAAESALKDAGFDVLVFVPSKEEESGLITCGNAVLSGSWPKKRISCGSLILVKDCLPVSC